MWTSYEAMCELGGPAGSSDETDDPKLIFGVPAPALSPKNKEDSMGVYRSVSFKREYKNFYSGAVGNQSFEEPLHGFEINRRGTPSTPYSDLERMKIGNYSNSNSRLFTDARQGELSDAQNFRPPASASTIASRTRERIGRLPKANLFNTTPALPVQRTFQSPSQEVHCSMLATPDRPEQSSAIGYANHVLDQARRVVAGLYYEPSPEATNPSERETLRMSSLAGHPTQRKQTSRRNFTESYVKADTAIVGSSSADLLFSSTPPATPHGASSPFHAGVSSVKGEKRALLSTANVVSRKKSDQEKEKSENSPPPVEMTLGKADDFNSKLDAMTECSHVGKVLELLCVLGAAYRYLCQVRYSHCSILYFNSKINFFTDFPNTYVNERDVCPKVSFSRCIRIISRVATSSACYRLGTAPNWKSLF